MPKKQTSDHLWRLESWLAGTILSSQRSAAGEISKATWAVLADPLLDEIQPLVKAEIRNE